MSLLPMLKSQKHMKQFLPHIITTHIPLTQTTFKHLTDISISPTHHHHLSLLFIQFQHLITTDLCNSLIRTYTQSNSHLHSVLIYTHMTNASVSPDIFTFPPLLKSISRTHLPNLGLSSHGHALKLGLAYDVFTTTALVTMYCAFGGIEDARNLFDEMPERNSVSWNAMITGYVHNRMFREGHELFTEMQASGVELSEVTVVGALSACAHLGALNQGVWIHNYIKKYGLRFNVFVGTALVDMYMKCGAADEAVEVFRSMRAKNVFSWNALISGFAMNGRGEAAMEAFDMMMVEDVRPDRVSFLAALGSCCHQGLVDEGRRIFERMEEEFGVRRTIEHYGCMVDLLSRAGFLDEAHELIGSMAMDADVVIWRALLAGCRIYGNARLGEYAIRKLLELEPGNGDNYVLLSNVLARDCRWHEVGEVRETMSQLGIQKVPGCSSIEIENVVYEFVVTSRTEKAGLSEIYQMLADMSKELKAAGYVVYTDMVSFDLEEEEKESSLMYHSEKLALAFGILRTKEGTTIRIVKNLRVCKDCHSFFKHVSKVYQREIVVRDRNRFHHFSGGFCSCRDYW